MDKQNEHRALWRLRVLFFRFGIANVIAKICFRDPIKLKINFH